MPRKPSRSRLSSSRPVRSGLAGVSRPVVRRDLEQSESDLVAATMEALTMRRVWAWRANSGTRVVANEGKRRVIKLSPPGTPDIIGIVPGTEGQLFGLEAKTSKGRLNANQKVWHAKAEAAGVRVGVFRTTGEALALVRLWSIREASN